MDTAPQLTEGTVDVPELEVGNETAKTTENVAEESSKLSGEDDPNESFSDYLKRVGSKKNDTPKETKKEVEEVKAPEEVSKDTPSEMTIKVGTKEFKAQDIEQLQKAHDDYKGQNNLVQSQVKELVNILKTEPGKILDRLEVPREIIEKYYFDKYLQPEVFKSMPAEEKVAHYEKQEQARKDAELKTKQDQDTSVKKQAEETQKEHYRQEWNKKFQETIESNGLPKSDWVVSRMAGYMKQALAKGLKHVTPQDVVPLIKEDLMSAQKATLSSLTPEQLAATLGADTMAKLREHESAQVKASKFENKNPGKGKIEKAKKEGKKYTNPLQMLDDL